MEAVGLVPHLAGCTRRLLGVSRLSTTPIESSKGRVYMHATSAMAARGTSLIRDQVDWRKAEPRYQMGSVIEGSSRWGQLEGEQSK